MLAVTSMCQEIAFGGVGEDGFLSAGLTTPAVQEFLNVRSPRPKSSDVDKPQTHRSKLKFCYFCAVAVDGSARILVSVLGPGGGKMDRSHLTSSRSRFYNLDGFSASKTAKSSVPQIIL